VQISCSKHSFNGPCTGTVCSCLSREVRTTGIACYFPTAKSKALMCMWDLSSRTSRTSLVAVGRTCSTTNCSHWRIVTPLIHPLSVQEAWHPVGAPSRSHSYMHFQTNMRNDGMNEPAALQQQITIVSCPCSGLAIMPTCLFPAVKWICSVDSLLKSVSQFPPCCKDVKCLFCAFIEVTTGKCRKQVTYGCLFPLDLAAEVGSGKYKVMCGCLLINPINQSSPAAPILKRVWNSILRKIICIFLELSSRRTINCPRIVSTHWVVSHCCCLKRS